MFFDTIELLNKYTKQIGCLLIHVFNVCLKDDYND